MINYYEVLQIDPKADQAVIRAAYRTLMKELGNHPDHGGATEQAQRINEAYSHLIDPQKRRMVDQRIRRWYSGTGSDRPKEDHNTYITCAQCGTTNRIRSEKIRRNIMVQCGSCRSVLAVDGTNNDTAIENISLSKLISRLAGNKWSMTGRTDEYFDAVLQNDFFLKNFIYLKKTKRLTRENIRDIALICKNTYRRHFAPVGHYFILVAEKIEHISYIVDVLKEVSEQMSGWSSGIIIPVDCSRKQVFLSHVNLNHHPADLMKLKEYLYS